MQAGGFGNVSLTCCDAEGWADQVTYTADLVAAGMVCAVLFVLSPENRAYSPRNPTSQS